jgi:hypothetical protein
MSETWSLKGQIALAHLSSELTDVFGARNGRGTPLEAGAQSSTLAGWGSWHSWGNIGLTQREGHEVRSDVAAIGGSQAGTAGSGSTAMAVVRNNGDASSLRARNAFERVLGRLNDLRRTVAHYEKTAINVLTAVHLASIVCAWF